MPSPAHADPNTLIADLVLQQKVLAKQLNDVRSDVRELARAVRYLTEVATAKPAAAAPPPEPAKPMGFDQFKKLTEGWDTPEVKWDVTEIN
jgi:hypothetical protein